MDTLTHVLPSVATTLTAVAHAASVASGGVATQAPSAIESLVESSVPSVVASMLPSAATTTTPVTSSVVTLPWSFELVAAFSGALFGGLSAVNAKFDLVGVMSLALVSGLGGGIIRDLLLQDQGIYALQKPHLIVAVLIAGFAAAFFAGAAKRMRPVWFLIDAVSLGLFAAAGADRALAASLTIVPAILLGAITAVGGSVLRDVLLDVTPRILRPGTYYAFAAVIGSTVYVLMVSWLHLVKPVALLVCLVLVMALRLLATMRGWQAPTPTDLTEQLAAIPGALTRRTGAMLRAAWSWLSTSAEADSAPREHTEC